MSQPYNAVRRKRDERGETFIEIPGSEKGIAVLAGWFVRKLKWIGRRNAPDRFFARAFDRPCPRCGTRGRVVNIEFKRKGKGPRVTQEREIARMRAAGLDVHVIDNYDEVETVLDL